MSFFAFCPCHFFYQILKQPAREARGLKIAKAQMANGNTWQMGSLQFTVRLPTHQGES